jgi:hypothetical protein
MTNLTTTAMHPHIENLRRLPERRAELRDLIGDLWADHLPAVLLIVKTIRETEQEIEMAQEAQWVIE